LRRVTSAAAASIDRHRNLNCLIGKMLLEIYRHAPPAPDQDAAPG
jgi:hypothetical protein